MPKLKFAIVGTAILGAIAFLMFNGINSAMIYYYTVPEVYAKGLDLSDRGIRVAGYVLPGSIKKDSSKSRVEFVVFEKDTDNQLPVVYEGLVPDTFKDHAEVVVTGKFSPSENVFHASEVLAKCPSKYQRQGGDHPEGVVAGASDPEATY